MDFSQFDAEVLLARGKYSTVRAEHERLKKELQQICSVMQGDISAILKLTTGDMQFDCTEMVEIFTDRLKDLSNAAEQCNVLMMQKNELKSIAYP